AIEAGGQRLCASCSASTFPVSASISTYATGGVPAAPAGTVAIPVRIAASAVILLIAPPPLRRTPRGARRASGAERRERVGPPEELIRLRADHVPVAVELAVEEQAAHVPRAPEKREKPLAREPLHHVAARVDEIRPHRADGGIV